MTSETTKETKKKQWLKKLGIWGFMFFLIKGLLWLIIPAVIYLASK